MAIHFRFQSDYTDFDGSILLSNTKINDKVVQQQSPQPSSIMQAQSKHSPPIQTVPKLEAEIRQNQRRIDRLQQRNAQLARQLAEIDQQYYRQPAHHAEFTTIRTPKSRPIQPNRPQLSRKWLSIGIVALCLALTCAIIGFAITRLVSVR